MNNISRRKFSLALGGIAALGMTGCAIAPHYRPRRRAYRAVYPARQEIVEPDYALAYGEMVDEGFTIPAVDLDKLDPRYYRRQIINPTGEVPGTIVVDTTSFYLYHVESDGMAWRYGVGLGRAGFEWAGRANMRWKKKWPHWKPPDEMIDRQPELAKYSIKNGGMPPGIDNPLGARALYIFQENVDTLYRINGSPEHASIGKAVSSGCVRMINQDVIHLYDRVKPGAPILVISADA